MFVHKARMHRAGWRTAHASSIDEKGLLNLIRKATSGPPRAGTTGNYENSTLFCRVGLQLKTPPVKAQSL